MLSNFHVNELVLNLYTVYLARRCSHHFHIDNVQYDRTNTFHKITITDMEGVHYHEIFCVLLLICKYNSIINVPAYCYFGL